MSRQKTKRKARRRALKHLERAWNAVERDHLHLAQREIDRALSERPDNPTLWNDAGRIYALRLQLVEAEQAFRNAVLLAPSYAEPYHHLADVLTRQGHVEEALAAASEAVRLDPHLVSYRERLRQLQTLAPASLSAPPAPPSAPAGAGGPNLALHRFDWDGIAQDLMRRGCAPLRGLLDPEECRVFLASLSASEPFEKRVRLSGRSGEGGRYSFFAPPLPDLIRALRHQLYARLAPIANVRQAALRADGRFPADLASFLCRCHAAGQARSTPIFLEYEAPARNEPHRDLHGQVVFPYQAFVCLSPRAEFEGGTFLQQDLATGRRAQRHEFEVDQGDVIVFSTRDRLTQVGGAHALQPVAHGMTPLTSGRRRGLGIPFHEFRGRSASDRTPRIRRQTDGLSAPGYG